MKTSSDFADSRAGFPQRSENNGQCSRAQYSDVEDRQKTLFEHEKDWQEEWTSMPEFVQKKQRAHATIIVRLRTAEDLKRFSELMGQSLTSKTKSIWYPFSSHWGAIKKRWIDES